MTDFYQGFEGEPELRIEARDGRRVVSALRMWSGYFDDLVRRIKPEATGWTGLARMYHLEEAFYERSPWRIEDLAAIMRQWGRIDLAGADDVTRQVHASVAALLSDACMHGHEVWIALD